MKPSTNKALVINSWVSEQIFDSQMTDLPDHILSEGPKAQFPKRIERLEENMSSIPLANNSTTNQAKELLENFEDQFEMNLRNWVQRDRKTNTTYKKNSVTPLLPNKLRREEEKQAGSIKSGVPSVSPTVTLKSEISFMLRALAEARKAKITSIKEDASNIAIHSACEIEQNMYNNIQKN